MIVQNQLRRKLHAINYPAAANFCIKINDLRHLIVWLEDRVIRIYPSDKRLRDISANEWCTYLDTYLCTLKCPFSEDDIPALTDWLIGKALLLLPANDPIFRKGVGELATILRIPNHPDVTQIFKASCKLVSAKLSKASVETATSEYGKTRIEMLKSDDVCLGFETNDPEVRAAAVGVRLLNVNDMRRMQDKANSAIVQVQRLTADPQTDEKLGKVGY